MLAQQYPGIDGFLGTRGSFMLDVVFVAMLVMIPLMLVSIYLVRYRFRYLLHKRIQISLAAILLVTVAIFEVEQRLVPWTARAVPSPYFDAQHKWSCAVGYSLLVHLLFAVPTAILWIYVVVQALRKFDRLPRPNAYSAAHRLWARLAAIGMTMTAVTGWVFFYLAYMAV